jgi:DNA-binding transcriptional regulator YdaS (Cro superfamily)
MNDTGDDYNDLELPRIDPTQIENPFLDPNSGALIDNHLNGIDNWLSRALLCARVLNEINDEELAIEALYRESLMRSGELESDSPSISDLASLERIYTELDEDITRIRIRHALVRLSQGLGVNPTNLNQHAQAARRMAQIYHDMAEQATQAAAAVERSTVRFPAQGRLRLNVIPEEEESVLFDEHYA